LGYDYHFNGNITFMNWTTNGSSHAYTFTYDGMNRITDAIQKPFIKNCTTRF
jgi:hypothetical protein